MSTTTKPAPLELRGSVRAKLEAIADRYGIDRREMWGMSMVQFAEAIERVVRARGRS